MLGELELQEEERRQPITDDEDATSSATMDRCYDDDVSDSEISNPSDDDEEDEYEIPIPDPRSSFSVDDSLSKALLKLSFEKRSEIQEEQHGVKCLAPDETEELVEESLLAFDRLLMKRKLRMELQVQREQYPTIPKSDTSSGSGSSRSSSSRNRRKKKFVLRNVISMGSEFQRHPPNAVVGRYHAAPVIGRTSPMSPPASSSSSTGFRRGGNAAVVDNCYLNDPNVRLRFLRCERFDVPKAVDRLVSFLELNTELFGDYVLERPIRISDFRARKEEVALQNSRNQYLPFRDRSGRRVFVGVGSCDLDIPFDLRTKIMMYLHWIASEDVETQQKGVVVIAWPTNEDGGVDDVISSWEKNIRPGFNRRLRTLQKRMSASMPLRLVCQQAYFPDTAFFRTLSTLYYIGMAPHERTLYKAHFGENTELRYALLGYGIPEQLLPLSNTGTVKTANHSRWINALRAKSDREERKFYKYNNNTSHNNNNNGNNPSSLDAGAGEEEAIVDCPGSRDVIFRKGPTYKNNPGNMYFRELIEQTHDRHMRASRKEKCNISWSIVEAIEARNGRFLDWSKSQEMWIVARDREKIRTKVAACYKRYNRTAVQKKLKSSKSVEPPRQQQQQQQQRQNQLQQPPEPLNATGMSAMGGAMPTSNACFDITSTTRLREYYGSTVPSKRRKTFNLFCGAGYTSSSSDFSIQ